MHRLWERSKIIPVFKYIKGSNSMSSLNFQFSTLKTNCWTSIKRKLVSPSDEKHSLPIWIPSSPTNLVIQFFGVDRHNYKLTWKSWNHSCTVSWESEKIYLSGLQKSNPKLRKIVTIPMNKIATSISHNQQNMYVIGMNK